MPVEGGHDPEAVIILDLEGEISPAESRAVTQAFTRDQAPARPPSAPESPPEIVAKTASVRSAPKATMPGNVAADTVQPAAVDRFTGDLTLAYAGDWIDLVATRPGDPTQIMLFARERLVMGKLRDAPVDLCARNYPLSVHKDACQHVSRQHVELRYHRDTGHCAVADLNSRNGTLLDGLAVPPGSAEFLEWDLEQSLVLSGTIALRLRCLSRQDGAMVLDGVAAAARADTGIESAAELDAVLITRPENRSELAYAMVLRRLSLGGAGADLVLAGARGVGAVDIARHDGRWICRAGADTPWRALTLGMELDCAGKRLRVTAGDHAHF